jgi:hypothetical protein
MAELVADIQNYYEGTTDILVGEILPLAKPAQD